MPKIIDNVSIVLVKPCAFELGEQWKLMEKVFLNQPYHITQLRYYERVNRSLLRLHYKEHLNEWYYERLEKHMLSGPTIVIEACGDVALIRANVLAARGNAIVPKTLLHASDSVEAGRRERLVWFGRDPVSRKTST